MRGVDQRRNVLDQRLAQGFSRTRVLGPAGAAMQPWGPREAQPGSAVQMGLCVFLTSHMAEIKIFSQTIQCGWEETVT